MKKITALILAFIMIMAVAPLNASAVEPDKIVENIGITIDPKIAGKTPADCAEFLTVSGEGITFDNTTFKATYIDGHFNNVKEAEIFEEGKSYTSILYLYPAEGYLFPYYAEEFVDIKYSILRSTGEVEAGYYLSAEGYGDDETAEYYKMTITYTAESQEPTGIARIPFLIGKFFDAIATFFTETFIQPIADLIMKLS